MTLKIAIVGPGRSGKGSVSAWMTAHTRLRYTGSTSTVILPHAARRLGIPEAEAWATRHANRDLWLRLGIELRGDDPAALAREVLRYGDIADGIRDPDEMDATLREGLVYLTLWIDRPVPPDPTLGFGPEVADAVIPNHGTLAELHGRLRRLANSWGVLKVC